MSSGTAWLISILISVKDQNRLEFSWLDLLNCLNVIYSHLWEHFANGDVLNHQHSNTETCFLAQSKLC